MTFHLPRPATLHQAPRDRITFISGCLKEQNSAAKVVTHSRSEISEVVISGNNMEKCTVLNVP